MPPNEQNPSRLGRRGTDAAEMSFGEHLEELRKHLIWALVGLVPFFFLGMYLAKDILDFLIRPVQAKLLALGQAPQLQATGATEIFGVWMRIAFIFTLLGGSWWIIVQLWMFVKPGLYAHERRFVYLLVPMSVALTLLSALFLYFVMLPVVLEFLIDFGSKVAEVHPVITPMPEGVVLPHAAVLAGDPPAPRAGDWWINEPLSELRFCLQTTPDGPVIKSIPLTLASGVVQQYRVREYIELILSMALAFAVGFQTPVVVLLLGWVGLIDHRWLGKQRKYAFFIAVIAAAALTPTGDPVTLSLLLAPLYALYELGVFLLRFLPADRVARGWRPGREPDGDADA
jgi:sec-independent protein translocase protein TatC